MDDSLFRLESAVTATASGDLTWERWTLDAAVALGFAGRRNPLGFAVARYLSDDPSSANVWDVVMKLSSLLIRRDIAHGSEANAIAWEAFDYWRDPHCCSCGGRAFTEDKRPCHACGGTGRRPLPDGPQIKDAVSCLIEAAQRMDGQLGARLRRD